MRRSHSASLLSLPFGARKGRDPHRRGCGDRQLSRVRHLRPRSPDARSDPDPSYPASGREGDDEPASSSSGTPLKESSPTAHAQLAAASAESVSSQRAYTSLDSVLAVTRRHQGSPRDTRGGRTLGAPASRAHGLKRRRGPPHESVQEAKTWNRACTTGWVAPSPSQRWSITSATRSCATRSSARHRRTLPCVNGTPTIWAGSRA